jgi:hypothetical protein
MNPSIFSSLKSMSGCMHLAEKYKYKFSIENINREEREKNKKQIYHFRIHYCIKNDVMTEIFHPIDKQTKNKQKNSS